MKTCSYEKENEYWEDFLNYIIVKTGISPFHIKNRFEPSKANILEIISDVKNRKVISPWLLNYYYINFPTEFPFVEMYGRELTKS